MVIVVHLRTLSVLVSLLLIVSLLPAGALAQSSSDPSAGSPPGVVYQLPLSKGRTDAAPRKDTGGPNADSSGSKGGSLYRSENNFGSSSHVPGSAGVDPNNSDPTGRHRSGTDLSGRGDPSLPTAAVDSGNTSLPGSLGLLALIVVAGVGIGYIALRSRRLGR
jgi:hypothetical protein